MPPKSAPSTDRPGADAPAHPVLRAVGPQVLVGPGIDLSRVCQRAIEVPTARPLSKAEESFIRGTR